MIEFLAPGFVYALLKDSWRIVRGQRRRLTPEQILQFKEKWKPKFEEEIANTHYQDLRKDIVIHNVRKLDSYPALEDRTKGISPWFRSSLLGTYHKGILVGLDWKSLVWDENLNSWRYARYEAGEEGELTAMLVGKILYEDIEYVEWDGDEFYNFPHIFCYFERKHKQPYDELVICEEKQHSNHIPYYLEIATAEQVREASEAAPPN